MPFSKPLVFFHRLLVARKQQSRGRNPANDTSSLGLPQHYQLVVEDEPEEVALEVLPHASEDFNESRWPRHPPWRPLGVFICDAGTIVAGFVSGNLLRMAVYQISLVRDDLRGRGIGRELIARAEARALERDCHAAWLDTFSFQARGFYEKLGYEEFGTLDLPTSS